MSRFMLATSFLSLTLSAASCGAMEESGELRDEPPQTRVPAAPAVQAPADSAMERTAECVNPQEGYAVLYPADWQVNPGDLLGPCSLFDPEPIDVPRGSELPLEIAIRIDFEAARFSMLTGDVLGRRDLVREPTIVDSREGMRIEGESTGEGLYDRGIRSYQYFVDLGDTTMVASTYEAGSLPYERKQRILDAMMARFDFRQPG